MAGNKSRYRVAAINRSQFSQHAFERDNQNTCVCRKIAAAAIVDGHIPPFSAQVALIS
jgi:hypothetical protein